MKRVITILLCCSLLVLVGCEKKEESKESGAEKSEKAEELPEPYTGELSHERFEGVAEMVTPFNSWEKGLARVEARLGKPTKVVENKYYWAFADDQKCTWFYVTKDDEGDDEGEKGKAVVGTIASPSTVSTDEPFDVWSECFGWAGKEIPVDPDAPLPPEDGSPVSVKTLVDGVAGAPSKWIGQQVEVEGVLNSTSRTKSNGKVVTVIVSVGQSPEELMTTVGCKLADIENVPTDGVIQKAAVTASGTVSASMGGTLDACELTVRDEPGDDAAPQGDDEVPE